jgi:simple sugar transport system substrate-binding protein
MEMRMTHLPRRTVLAGALAAPALLSRAARAADPLKIGFVYVAPIGDAGWTFQHELGRRALQASLGDKVKTSYVENVSEGADSERVIRQLAADGNGLIFTTSFGYMNPTIKVAKEFPKGMFEHATGYKRAENVATYSARFYEGRYLGGLIAGHMSKTGVIGYVAAFPIPEVVQGINATLLGARKVNPKVTIKVVWTSSWFDPGKERAAADTLMSQGADVLTHHTDSSAVVQAGEEKGVWTLGYDSDMSKYGPKTCLTATTMIWDQYYIKRAGMALDGTWKSTDTWGGIGEGMIKMAPLNKAVPEAVAQELVVATNAIAAGRFKPFVGPVTNQAGKVAIPAGQALSDPDILGMNWFAEGVEGKI